MANMTELISIITLALLVLAQAVERFFYAKSMNEQLSKATKAIMSRNINEYLSALNADKPAGKEVAEDEEVELDQATDAEFLKHIKSQEGV